MTEGLIDCPRSGKPCDRGCDEDSACIGVQPFAPSDKPRWPCPGQSASPSDAEIGTAVHQAIEAWKTARELPYLSPSACKLLNELIVAGLRPVVEAIAARAHEAGRKDQREDDRYGER